MKSVIRTNFLPMRERLDPAPAGFLCKKKTGPVRIRLCDMKNNLKPIAEFTLADVQFEVRDILSQHLC